MFLIVCNNFLGMHCSTNKLYFTNQKVFSVSVETDKWFVLRKLFKRHVLLVVAKHAYYLAVTVGPSVFHSRRLGEGWV